MLKILADSVNIETGDRITTFLVPIWKVLQAELRTHRSTGQSHYSSRAIPTSRLLEQVKTNPFIPIWYEYQKGMAGSNSLSNKQKTLATEVWFSALSSMAYHVEKLVEIGISKEQRNRLLEPFMIGDCVVSASDYAWKHFFELRCTDGVQPEFKELALKMQSLYEKNLPSILKVGEWHIAFEEKGLPLIQRLKVSAARCARTSYLNHQNSINYQKDFTLCDRLLADKHLTPFEHQFCAMPDSSLHSQYKGFQSLRDRIKTGLKLSSAS